MRPKELPCLVGEKENQGLNRVIKNNLTILHISLHLSLALNSSIMAKQFFFTCTFRTEGSNIRSIVRSSNLLTQLRGT